MESRPSSGTGAGGLNNGQEEQTDVYIAPSEQIKPTDLRDAVRPSSAIIGENEATASASEKREVYSRPALGSSTSTDATGVNHGQENGATVTSGNSPLTSADKGSDVSGTVQENSGIISSEGGNDVLAIAEAIATQQDIAEAEAEVNTNPTEGQKKAGNYKMGHVKIDGYDVTIENPKGSVRRGVDPNGKAWEQELRDAIVDTIRKAGIEVSTDWEEGQRVLDMFKDAAKMMAVDTSTPEYKKKVNDARKRIEERLEEYKKEKEQNPQPASREPIQEPTSPQQSGGKGSTPSGAKVSKKLHQAKELAEKMADFIVNMPNNINITPENFAKQVIDALGLPKMESGTSQYAFVISDDGNTYTIRISDHKGNARNIIIRGIRTKEGYSIVLKAPNSKTTDFRKTAWAKVHEYVYDNPDREQMTNIAKSIFSTDWEEGQRVLEEVGAEATLSRGQKRAVETASLIQKEGSRADISTVDGAKVIQNLDNLAKDYERNQINQEHSSKM